MPSFNRCFLMGNLTREVELSYSPKGTPIAALGLAVNRVWTGEENRKHEEATFVDVTLWARLAEIADKFLRKGNPVFIEGRLQLDTWEHNGQKHSRLRVIGENLQLLGKRLDSISTSTTPGESKSALVSSPSSARPPPGCRSNRIWTSSRQTNETCQPLPTKFDFADKLRSGVIT